MAYQVRPLEKNDYADAAEIFNHYVKNSFAAFPDRELPAAVFAGFMEGIKNYPALALAAEGELAGFAFLRPYSPFSTFRQTAEVAYFLAPKHTGKGGGTLLLDRLEKECAGLGIKNLVATISGLNEASLSFHRRRGFTECGRLRSAGAKLGSDFDVVLMQKAL